MIELLENMNDNQLPSMPYVVRYDVARKKFVGLRKYSVRRPIVNVESAERVN